MHLKLFTLFLLICFLFPHVSGLHRASHSAKQRTQRRRARERAVARLRLTHMSGKEEKERV